MAKCKHKERRKYGVFPKYKYIISGTAYSLEEMPGWTIHVTQCMECREKFEHHTYTEPLQLGEEVQHRRIKAVREWHTLGGSIIQKTARGEYYVDGNRATEDTIQFLWQHESPTEITSTSSTFDKRFHQRQKELHNLL